MQLLDVLQVLENLLRQPLQADQRLLGLHFKPERLNRDDLLERQIDFHKNLLIAIADRHDFLEGFVEDIDTDAVGLDLHLDDKRLQELVDAIDHLGEVVGLGVGLRERGFVQGIVFLMKLPR